jgi:hypothetical protein
MRVEQWFKPKRRLRFGEADAISYMLRALVEGLDVGPFARVIRRRFPDR